MKRYIVLDKQIGETPLAAIQDWKKENQEYTQTAACYAGRLDPMASGKLLILLGDECKRQRVYTDLDKEYEIEILLDVGSDTGDALGIPEYTKQKTLLAENALRHVLTSECGAHSRVYPKFSSKTVGGKPLFLHTLEGTLADIKIPEHIEHIYKIKNKNSFVISTAALEERITKFLDCVPRTDEPSKKLGADFRVDGIRTHWKSLFEKAGERNFIVLRMQVTCASGTYMRSLAGRIGTELGTDALALSISRTKIGNYIPVYRNIGFWSHTFY